MTSKDELRHMLDAERSAHNKTIDDYCKRIEGLEEQVAHEREHVQSEQERAAHLLRELEECKGWTYPGEPYQGCLGEQLATERARASQLEQERETLRNCIVSLRNELEAEHERAARLEADLEARAAACAEKGDQ